VCSGDEVDGIIVRKRLGDVRSEKETCSARGKTPTGDICNTKNSLDFMSRTLCAGLRVARDKRKRPPSGSDHSRSHIGPS
jgi:hypothetical protein